MGSPILPGITPQAVLSKKTSWSETTEITNMDGFRPHMDNSKLDKNETLYVINTKQGSSGFTWQDLDGDKKFDPKIDGFEMTLDWEKTPDGKQSKISYESPNFIRRYGNANKAGKEYFSGSVHQFGPDGMVASTQDYVDREQPLEPTGWNPKKPPQHFSKEQEASIRKLAVDWLTQNVNSPKTAPKK
jgi:hypothetical protein